MPPDSRPAPRRANWKPPCSSKPGKAFIPTIPALPIGSATTRASPPIRTGPASGSSANTPPPLPATTGARPIGNVTLPVGVTAVQGQAFSGVLATFSDPGGRESLSDYMRSGRLGRQHGRRRADRRSPTTPTAGCSRSCGSHTYAEEGTYTVSVTVYHDMACPATATSSITVANAPPQAQGGVAITANEYDQIAAVEGRFVHRRRTRQRLRRDGELGRRHGRDVRRRASSPTAAAVSTCWPVTSMPRRPPDSRSASRSPIRSIPSRQRPTARRRSRTNPRGAHGPGDHSRHGRFRARKPAGSPTPTRR